MRTTAARHLAVCAAAVLLAGCSSPRVIGVLLPMTGEAAPYGAAMKEAIELAVDEAKAADEYPAGLTLLWADSATDPDTAVAQLRELSSQGAKLVIAAVTSDSAKAMLPVLEETQTVALSPSASAPMLTKNSRLFFRVFTSDELEGSRIARFLREDQGRASVLIFAEDSEQARGIEPVFRQNFEQAREGTVVGKVSLDAPNWRQEAADILTSAEPESVFIVAYAEKTLAAVRLLREMGYDGVIAATSAFYSGDLVTENAALLDDVYFAQPAFDTQDVETELVRSFVESFRQRYGDDPDIYAAHAYDAIRVAMAVTTSVRAFQTNELRKELIFEIREFPGVTGPIQFNDYGDVRHNPVVFVIKDGEVRNYERWVDAEKERIRRRIGDILRGQG